MSVPEAIRSDKKQSIAVLMSVSADKAENPSGWDLFRRDLVDCWNRMPYKAFFFAALALWAALFQFLGNSTFGYVDTGSLFGWLNWVYNINPDDGAHGKLIPFVVLGLFWWKRKDIVNQSKSVWFPALGLIFAALVLHILGYFVQQTRLSLMGFFLGVYGLMGLFWGWPVMKASFFPFFLLAFCLPLGSMAQSITVPLRLLVSSISVGFAHVVLGIDVIREGTRIFNPDFSFSYDVAPACSGIRSLIAIFSLTTIYAFMFFKAWWKRLLMISVALPLALLGNLIRIIGVIVIAEAFSQNAGMKFHDWAGFVTFAMAFIGVLTLGYFLEEEKTRESDEPQTASA